MDIFLSQLKGFSDWVGIILSNGSCYKLSKLLDSMYDGDVYIVFRDGKPMHSVFKYKYKLYDINGIYYQTKDEVLVKFSNLNPEIRDEVESWGFDNTRTIAGRCQYCGEIGVVSG